MIIRQKNFLTSSSFTEENFRRSALEMFENLGAEIMPGIAKHSVFLGDSGC